MIIEVVGKEIEKIKGDFESYLNGLNMVGEISYSQYSELYNEGTKQIQKAYELGKSELEKENAELKDKLKNLENVAEVRLANWQKYEKAYNEAEELLDKQIEATYNVVEENKEAKEIIKELLFTSNELDEKSVVEDSSVTASDGKRYRVKLYNLDAIISVGYRVKSNRGVEFRRWANSVLKQYILQGYAVNQRRIQQLGEVIRIMKRTENELDSKQILSVIERYNNALDLLDAYDHQTIKRPKGNEATYVLTYEECIEVIQSMRFGDESDLFGKEKDDSFKGSIGNIYQSFGGSDVYKSLEEKAANLLYFVTKNHSFYDGNKRIAATMFLYFLDKNDALFYKGQKRIEDATLVALTIMIAESSPTL